MILRGVNYNALGDYWQTIALNVNPDTGTLHLEAAAIPEGITELWIPDYFGAPNTTGTNATLQNLKPVTGGYYATILCSGTYSIDVAF